MRYILKYFIKRLPREGFKSMSVSALALALVFLINVMAGVKAEMQADYDDTIDNYPIFVEVSDGDGTATDGLNIGAAYLKQFTDPEALWSLAAFVEDVQLTRALEIVEERGPAKEGRLLGLFDAWSVRDFFERNGSVDSSSFAIEIYEYDDYSWVQYENVCMVTEDLLEWVEDGVLNFSILKRMGPNTRVYDFSPRVVGVVRGVDAGWHVFSFASTVSGIISTTGSQPWQSYDTFLLNYGGVITVSDREFRLLRQYMRDMEIDYFEGYSSETSLYLRDKHYCVVSEDLLEFAEEGVLKARVSSAYDNELSFEIELTAIGVLNGEGEGVVLIAPESAYGLVYYYTCDIQFTPKIPVVGYMRGVTSVESIKSTAPGTPARVEFYDGYDKSIFSSDENVCIVSEDMMKYEVDGVFIADVRSGAGAYAKNVEAALRIVGTVSGAGEGVVYAPFSIVSLLGGESDGGTPYTESIRATVADNRNLVGFKYEATRTFKEVGVFFNTQTFSMTIYDSEFYNITEALMQTIFFIDIAMPFVYIIAICVGFIASFLLTRRRKAEFASMRSLGVNKMKIFFGTLFEQALLCALGVIISCLVFYFTWGYFFYERALIFLGCYVLGAVISAARAAGTNVLRLLREKE